MGDHTDKWRVKDLFYDKWKTRWSDLSTCCQTKFWLEDPDCLGDALARLDRPTLSLALQAITTWIITIIWVIFLNRYVVSVGNHGRSSYTSRVSAQHLQGCAWILSGGISLIENLLTYAGLSGSWKWTVLARPWNRGQSKLSHWWTRQARHKCSLST